MRKRWRHAMRILGEIVPPSQANRCAEVRVLLELGDLGSGHDSTLQSQAGERRFAELRLIIRINRAQISLGGHVQPDGFCDFVPKQGLQIRAGGVLMMIVHAVVGGIVRQLMQQMSHIVQQRRGDQLGRSMLRFRECRRLQCELQLRNGSPPYCEFPRAANSSRI